MWANFLKDKYSKEIVNKETRQINRKSNQTNGKSVLKVSYFRRFINGNTFQSNENR